MSVGPPRIRSMNISEPENKVPLPSPTAKHPTAKKPGTPVKEEASNKKGNGKAASVLRQKSMNASCSSEASSDSVASSSSSAAGRLAAVRRRRDGVVGVKPRKQCGVRVDKERKETTPIAGGLGSGGGGVGGDIGSVVVESKDEARGGGGDEGNVKGDCFEQRKRCVWVTPTSDQCYVSFHDVEWGVPSHDDKKLFELLSLSGALAELTWPAILSKRNIFRGVFLDFDPFAVSRLNEKKLLMPGSPASSLLSELKLRSIVENARQMCKVIDEFGSFNKYIWNFVNHKAIVNQFRYSRQVPVKTSKADAISKDLVKRGFRCVGPTVIYSFMQAAGLTNDHLTSCFRYQECITGLESRENDEASKGKFEKKGSDAATDVERGNY